MNRNGVVTYRPDCADCHRALDRVAKRLKRAMHRPAGGSNKRASTRRTKQEDIPSSSSELAQPELSGGSQDDGEWRA